jgi:hypothetical protein
MSLDSRHVARYQPLAGMIQTTLFPFGSTQLTVTCDSSSTFAYPVGLVLNSSGPTVQF